MRTASRLSLVVGACLLSGCFHQLAQAGRTPGTTVIERPWTATWLWGLVPADEISVVAQCPNGVATVETQQSFLNGLVGGLTLGIYTPQEVRVPCASASGALPGVRHTDVAQEAPISERVAAIREAIGLAVETHETVQVRY